MAGGGVPALRAHGILIGMAHRRVLCFWLSRRGEGFMSLESMSLGPWGTVIFAILLALAMCVSILVPV